MAEAMSDINVRYSATEQLCIQRITSDIDSGYSGEYLYHVAKIKSKKNRGEVRYDKELFDSVESAARHLKEIAEDLRLPYLTADEAWKAQFK